MPGLADLAPVAVAARRGRRGFSTAALAALIATLAGCGDDGEGRRAAPAATATVRPAATATSEPTATAALPPTATPTIVPTATPTLAATATPSTTVAPTPAIRAVARRISDPADLIGGPMAVGRVGDYLLANDRIRLIVRDVGRQFSFLLTYGGNIVDADLVRPPGEPGRDNFGAMTPGINISSTVNVQSITVVNDGSNGEPAVIRTAGVDDLLDAIDPTNAIREFGVGAIPVSAQDRDIPVEIVTEYTLAAGESAARIETSIKNVGDAPLSLYVGDYVNGSGELDTFVPPLGFGEAVLRLELPMLVYSGIDANRHVSYGLIPVPLEGIPFPAGGFTQGGVTAYAIGQSLLSIILGQQPGVLSIAPGATRSYARYFAVGDGDVGSIADVRQRLFDIPGAKVTGCVTSDGAGMEGAFVSVVTRPGEQGAEFNVVNSFRSDAGGRFEGILPPGDYLLLVKQEGHPYDSGTTRPNEHPLHVPDSGENVVLECIEIPPTGRLRVRVRDASGNPIPARVTLVGFDSTPDPRNTQSVAGFNIGAAVFHSNVKAGLPFGIAGFHYIGVSGDSGEVAVKPGEYHAVISHGPEFSIHSERITISPRQTAAIDATLVRVVDTSGFVAADYHVHLTNSPDSNVTRDERIGCMAAEGLEYFVASDHDFRTDLSADIVRLGFDGFVRQVVSDEITTFNIGHFNNWPLPIDPGSITGGALDWGRAGEAPGRDYPQYGSWDLSPAEIFAARPPGSVMQINHINSHFVLAGIDSGQDPPQSMTNPAEVRQDPAHSNIYSDDYTALELWIEGNRGQTATLLNNNFGDWFNLLNQGRIKTGTADSDTHSTLSDQTGGPRNYVASSTDTPAELDHVELAASVNAGRVIGSNAPMVRFCLIGDGGASASLGFGEPQTVAASARSVTVRLNIQSPLWAEFDRIDVFTNTVPTPVLERNFHGVDVPRYRSTPALTLNAGTDFTVRTVVIDEGIAGAARLEADVDIVLALERDSWVVVLVRGTDGVSRPLFPFNPQDLQAALNPTLDDLMDGNLGEGGNLALAFTNPLYADVDGNGRYDP